MNFQRVDPGVYDYINTGSWHEGILSLDDDMIQMNRSDMVRSVCSEPCSKGEIKARDVLFILFLVLHWNKFWVEMLQERFFYISLHVLLIR